MEKWILIILGLLLLGVGMVSASCTDSDGGNDVYTYGTTTSTEGSGGMPAGTYTDSCDSFGDIYEYACPTNSSTVVDVYYVSCPSGYTCSEGACAEVVTVSTPSCVDADCSSGYVCDTSSNACYTSCSSNSNCASGYGCDTSTSTCVADSCSDSDGSTTAYTTAGTITAVNGTTTTYKDLCVGTKNLKEYGCSGTSVTSTKVACSIAGLGYTCSSGKCRARITRAAEYVSGNSLPWVLGGLGLLLLAGVGYWHFKGTKYSKIRRRK